MRFKVVSLLAAAISFGAGQAALAADMPVKAVRAPVVAAYNWSGCYVGGYVGGAGGSNVNAAEPTSTGGTFAAGTFYNTPNGASYSYKTGGSFIGGGTLGCNWQAAASPLVLGVEGELGYLRLTGSVVDPNSVIYGSDSSSSTKIGDWYGVVAGRAGYAVDRILFFGKAGVAFTNNKSTFSDTCTTGACGGGRLTADGSANNVAFAAGGGVEYAIYANWTVKAEYLWLGFNRTYSVCGPGAAGAAGSTFCANYSTGGVHTGKLGLNYKF